MAAFASLPTLRDSDPSVLKALRRPGSWFHESDFGENLILPVSDQAADRIQAAKASINSSLGWFGT
jgi:hypothetical protein